MTWIEHFACLTSIEFIKILRNSKKCGSKNKAVGMTVWKGMFFHAEREFKSFYIFCDDIANHHILMYSGSILREVWVLSKFRCLVLAKLKCQKTVN